MKDAPGRWHSYRKEFLGNACKEFELNTTGLKGFEEDDSRECFRRKVKKRKECEEENPNTEELNTDQWEVSESIGGMLYNTKEEDSRWQRNQTFELIAERKTHKTY